MSTLGVSQIPNERIVDALNKMTETLNTINHTLSEIHNRINRQTQYLEAIARKYNKKWFKRKK